MFESIGYKTYNRLYHRAVNRVLRTIWEVPHLTPGPLTTHMVRAAKVTGICKATSAL